MSKYFTQHGWVKNGLPIQWLRQLHNKAWKKYINRILGKKIRQEGWVKNILPSYLVKHLHNIWVI